MPDAVAPPTSALPVRTVVLSIAGVWAVYFVLVTIRSFIVDGLEDPSEHIVMLGLRAIVALASALLTALIWQVLRRMGDALAPRIVAIALLAVPVAWASAGINNMVFGTLDKEYSLIDEGETRVARDADGNFVIDVPGAPIVVVPDPHRNDPMALWKELTDIAVGRYFLVLAWGALFLALGNAERVRAAERQMAALQRAARAAELRSLRYQVNPHFLFNTLNSLSALVMTGKAAEAEDMIQTLSTFYRTSLTSDATVDVRLDEEVKLQRLYLDIEAIRFPGRLLARFEIPDALASACVPGLILQPLVENAIKHGVAPIARPVTIIISARMTQGMLQLIVADDGAGGASGTRGMGIGLTNVRERLAARYGGAATIEAGPVAPGYAVRLTLPLVTGGC